MRSHRPCRLLSLQPHPSTGLLLVLVVVVVARSGDNCTVCPSGELVTFPSKQLTIRWPVSVPNCTKLDEYARLKDVGSKECADVRAVGTMCGCPVSENSCRLCAVGRNITKPEKRLPFLSADFDGFIPTCEFFDAYLHSVNANSERCKEAQSIGSICGCSVTRTSCTVCPNGEDIDNPRRQLPQLRDFKSNNWNFFYPPTCEVVDAVALRLEEVGTVDCRRLQHVGPLCGCSVDEEAQRRDAVLAWLPRVPAILSLFGSLFIIYDISKKPKSQRTIHHHLLLGLSCSDCLYSIAWAFTTVPTPTMDEYGNPTNIYGARGNKATCMAQGFFIQLGLTSPFYNLAMAVHHMLVIVYEWNDDRLKKVRWLLYLVPAVVGLGLALGAIPLYDVDASTCCIATGGRNLLVFFVIPICIVIAFATLIMLKIYLKVYRQQRVARNWSMTSNAKSITRKVFWQAFWYLMCFYVSWPILVVISFIDNTFYNAYRFLCLAIVVAPLQGLLNFINYSRLRFLRFVNNKRCFSCKPELWCFSKVRKAELEHNVEISASDEADPTRTGSLSTNRMAETSEESIAS